MENNHNDSQEINSVARVFQRAARIYGNKPAFATRTVKNKFESVSYQKLYESGINLATALIEIGVEAREHVGLISDNRFEWILADYAVQFCGAADVPRGSDLTDQDIQYILPHAGVRVLFVETEAVLEKIQKNISFLPEVKHIILMDDSTLVKGEVLRIYDLVNRGQELRVKGDRRVEKRIRGIKPDDLFTLIYTSGTTGTPKGVMLTQENLMSQLRNLPMKISPEDRILSILPVWHIFERTFEMGAIHFGACTYYTNVRNLRDDLSAVRPTFMASAPRLWEMIYQGIISKVEKSPFLINRLTGAAIFLAGRMGRHKRFLRGNEIDLTGRSYIFSFVRAIFSVLELTLIFLPTILLDRIVLKKIRQATGGALRFSVSGGGALPAHVDVFFNDIGISVLEGYGLTETSPIISTRTPGSLTPGTVGTWIGETDLRLIDINTGNEIYNSNTPYRGRGIKGEIHVRGPQVMAGYYKNPEATRKVLNGGWFNTGDLGIVTYKNNLKIVGRSKETIVLLSGENVEPVPIENKLLESSIIEQVMVIGQDRKFLMALIVPNQEAPGMNEVDLASLAGMDSINERYKQEIKSLINAQNGFKSFERVVDCILLPKAFEKDDELTAKLSLKRHVIYDKYRETIDEKYL